MGGDGVADLDLRDLRADGFDGADDLVAGDQGKQFRDSVEAAVNHFEIGGADAGGGDAEEDFAGADLGVGDVAQFERGAAGGGERGSHRRNPFGVEQFRGARSLSGFVVPTQGQVER